VAAALRHRRLRPVAVGRQGVVEAEGGELLRKAADVGGAPPRAAVGMGAVEAVEAGPQTQGEEAAEEGTEQGEQDVVDEGGEATDRRP